MKKRKAAAAPGAAAVALKTRGSPAIAGVGGYSSSLTWYWPIRAACTEGGAAS